MKPSTSLADAVGNRVIRPTTGRPPDVRISDVRTTRRVRSVESADKHGEVKNGVVWSRSRQIPL
jgi:hypothetical protein